MDHQRLPIYAVAFGILIAGALAAGVQVETLLLFLFVLACPLMMLFMHGGHGGHGENHAARDPSQPNTDEHHHTASR